MPARSVAACEREAGCLRPELIVLDEPVAALDPIARREFRHSLLELTQDEQHTVLFSTHITSDLERVASHVAKNPTELASVVPGLLHYAELHVE